MKIETNKASGFILNYLVMVAEGHNYEIVDGAILTGRTVWRDFLAYDEEYSPSTNRDQGYEIFDRERIGFKYTGTAMGFVAWLNGELSTKYDHYGKDPLEAGLRVYVHKKLGEEVDVPDELIQLGETV